MKHRIWPYLLFALLSGGLSLGVMLQDAPKRDQGIAWESFRSEDVKSVFYQSPKLKVRFTPLSINYGWIEYEEEGKPVQTLLAGPKGKDFWFDLSPLWASKVLGDAGQLKLAEYGLDQDDKILGIDLQNGKKLSYRIGGRGFQSSDFFVLDLQKQAVFLWDRRALGKLERAPAQLAIDSPSFLNPEALNKIVLSSAGKSRVLLRNARDWKEGDKAIFAEDPLLKWLADVSKLKLAGQRKGGSSNDEPLFSLALEGDSAFTLRFRFDAAAMLYVISLGEDKPELLLDEKTFGPFYEDFRAGKILPKI